MVELYTTAWMDNTTNPVDLIVGVGTSIGNPFLIGNLILLGFFMVFLILSLKNDFLEVLATDAFITTIVAILFAFANLVSFATIVYPAIIFFLTLIFMFINR